jgi:hypothetical protein
MEIVLCKFCASYNRVYSVQLFKVIEFDVACENDKVLFVKPMLTIFSFSPF